MTAWRLAALATGVLLTGCSGRSLFDKPGEMLERVNPTIAAGRYRTIATIAGGGGSHIDLQVSVTARTQLEDSGFAVVRRAGRWADERSAVRAICAPDAVPVVDGVVFVWYNRLELRDCATESVAYEISASADQGITQMTDRLIRYLRRPPGPEPKPSP